MIQNNFSDSRSSESNFLTPDNKQYNTYLSAKQQTQIDLHSTPLCEPYFMNSPASNSTTLNCVDDLGLINDKLLFSLSDQVNMNKEQSANSITVTHLSQNDNNNFQQPTQNLKETMIKQKPSCTVRNQPLFTEFYLNDDNENDIKRGKSQSCVSEDLRGRAQTKNIFDIKNKNHNNRIYEESDDDSYTDSNSDSYSSDSNSSNYQKNDNNYQNYGNQDFLISPALFCQQQDIQFEGLINNQQYSNADQNQQLQNYQQCQQGYYMNGQQQQYQDIEHQNQQQQGLLKKGIQKDDNQKEKRKFKYGYKNMTREQYQEYRMQKAQKRDKKRLEKEMNAGNIETQMFFKLVLVEEKDKVKKKYIPKHIREQQQLENSGQNALQTNQVQKNQLKVLRKSDDQQSYEIFQFSRNADRPLVRTVHKKELVIPFQVETENEFAQIEIGVFNYQDNIEFYFINKFKIINKFVNRKYNDNKYFETELTTEDFVFKNGSRFEFCVKYNCIILKNLDTHTSSTLYCEKYIASNRKLNIFIRMFRSGDAVNLL